MNPQHIVPSTPQQGDAVSRHVFVSAQTHRVFSLARGGKDPFLTQQVSRVSQAGAHVFLREAGIIPQNFFLAPSFGEQIQYELNRQTGSSNDGLAGQNRRVSADVVMPVHEAKLPLFNEGSKGFLTPKKCRGLGDEELYEGGRVGQFPCKHTALAKMCSRAWRFGDFSKDWRRTKSTGRPISSSASPALSNNSAVETGADSSSVTSRSTSLPGAACPRATEPKTSKRRRGCFSQNGRSRRRSSSEVSAGG